MEDALVQLQANIEIIQLTSYIIKHYSKVLMQYPGK